MKNMMTREEAMDFCKSNPEVAVDMMFKI